MINIEIVGKIKNKKLVHKMCTDVLAELLPRLRRHVEVSIFIVTACEDQVCGFCSGDREKVDIQIARRAGSDRFEHSEILTTICHELVHAKQFIKGELTCDPKWMGVSARHLTAEQQPWEHEAFSLEKILYNKYANGIT